MIVKQLAQLQKAGFILKPDAPEIKPVYEQIREAFESRGIAVLLSEKSAKMIGLEGVAFESMCEEADFLVSIGGDTSGVRR